MLSGPVQRNLDDLQRMQSDMETLQRQISSGLRVQLPSDDPFAVPSILETQSRIGLLQQNQTDLNQTQSELSTGDAVLQQAIQAIDSAISLASQSSSPLAGANQLATLAQQVQGIQQMLVGISGTTAGGRYIFSGDYDQQAMYQLDPTQPLGVRQLVPASSTRVVTDAGGTQVWKAKTAQEIFDLRDSSGNPASGNVFSAINSLLTALQSNNSAGAVASISSLKAASDHLNQELGYYGIGETRVGDTLDAQSTAITREQKSLSNLRDTDMASAAVELTQLQTQQQASLAATGKFPKMNLFEFLA